MSKSPELKSEVVDKSGSFDIRSMMAATLEQGKDPEQAAYGQSGVIDSTKSESFAEDTAQFSPWEDSIVDGEGNGESSQEAASSGSDTDTENGELSSNSATDMLDKVDSTEAKAAADIETITLKIKDSEGRPQKLKVDYSDREAIKKAYMQAAGMRKFQAERDTVKKEMADIQTKYTELNQVYSSLDAAFQKDGVKGVVALLGQGNNPWEDAVNQELNHRKYLANLTPAEKYQLEVEEKQKGYESQLKAERTRREEFERKIAEKEEQAALKSLESRLHPSFDRYRFAGKLGDPVVEHQFDEAVWNKVVSQLAEYPDSAELTQAVIDKEFRTVANNFRKIISQQTEKTVQKTIENKKADASQRAQVAAKKGLSGNSDSRRFVEDVKSGNIKDAFAAMFSGKVKL